MTFNYNQVIGLRFIANLGYLSAANWALLVQAHWRGDEKFSLKLKSNPNSNEIVTFNTEVGIWSENMGMYLSQPGSLQYTFKNHLRGDETWVLKPVNGSSSMDPIQDDDEFGMLCGKHYVSWDGSGALETKKHLEAYERLRFGFGD